MRFLSLIVGAACLLTSTLSAFDQGDWLVRGRAIYVLPDDDTNAVTGAVVGSTVSVHSAFVPELDISYMLTQNIGLELILATARHTLHGEGALAGTKIGSVWLLPPTLLVQYHFRPCCTYQPYVGAGINHTFMYNEKTPLTDTKLSLSDSTGFAAQAGMDIMLGCDWFLNFDLKYISLDTKATLKGTVAGTAKVDIDPWVFGVGLGRRF